jgi:hypothetical protein
MQVGNNLGFSGNYELTFKNGNEAAKFHLSLKKNQTINEDPDNHRKNLNYTDYTNSRIGGQGERVIISTAYPQFAKQDYSILKTAASEYGKFAGEEFDLNCRKKQRSEEDYNQSNVLSKSINTLFSENAAKIDLSA